MISDPQLDPELVSRRKLVAFFTGRRLVSLATSAHPRDEVSRSLRAPATFSRPTRWERGALTVANEAEIELPPFPKELEGAVITHLLVLSEAGDWLDSIGTGPYPAIARVQVYFPAGALRVVVRPVEQPAERIGAKA